MFCVSGRWLWYQRRQRICGTATTCCRSGTASEPPQSGNQSIPLFLKVFFNTFAFWTPKRTVNGIHFRSSLRKVQTESSTGSVGSSRVRTTLTLCVETVDFDSQACQLRVKGTNIEENQYVKVRNIWSVCYLGPRHILVYSHVHVLFGTGYTGLITQLFTKCSTISKYLWGLKLLTEMCKYIFNSKKRNIGKHLQIVSCIYK